MNDIFQTVNDIKNDADNLHKNILWFQDNKYYLLVGFFIVMVFASIVALKIMNTK